MTKRTRQPRCLRLGVFIPSGVGRGYSGPAVFLKRLLGPLEGRAEVRLYSGVRQGASRDDSFYAPTESMTFATYGAREQLSWSLHAIYWLVRDARRLDIVHVHGTPAYNLLPMLVCILTRTPYVLIPLSSRADITETGFLSKFRLIRWGRRLVVRRAAAAFALATEIQEELQFLGLPNDRVQPIWNPVTDAFFDPSPTDRRRLRTVGFFGAMGPRKQPLLVLEAVAQMRARGENARAVFVGPMQDADYRNRFETAVAALGLDDLVVWVPFSESVATIMLNDVSVFVLPSQQEGLPGAMAEALAAGLPCVVTEAGAMGEVARASGGGIVVAAEASAIAKALGRLMEEESEWTRLSRNGRTYAEAHFRQSAVSNSYLRCLEKMTANDRLST